MIRFLFPRGDFLDNNMIENNGASAEDFREETVTKSGRFFRGSLITAITVLFAVFVYLLLYFSENTGA